MNRGSFFIGLLALSLAATPAFAQYKPYTQGKPKAPIVRVIPPSTAVKLALAQNPGAKALGVRLRSDNNYVVTLRLGNVVMREIIPGN